MLKNMSEFVVVLIPQSHLNCISVQQCVLNSAAAVVQPINIPNILQDPKGGAYPIKNTASDTATYLSHDE